MSEKAETNLPKLQTPFSFEGEVSEIKITIPLTELIIVDRYRSQIFKVFDVGNEANTLNLIDDKLELFFRPQNIRGIPRRNYLSFLFKLKHTGQNIT